MALDASSFSWVSKPFTLPSSRTKMRSASCTLEIRWEIISFVVPGILVEKACRILASVAVSTALVESSKISILGFFSKARAMQRRCSARRIYCCPPARSRYYIYRENSG